MISTSAMLPAMCDRCSATEFSYCFTTNIGHDVCSNNFQLRVIATHTWKRGSKFMSNGLNAVNGFVSIGKNLLENNSVENLAKTKKKHLKYQRTWSSG